MRTAVLSPLLPEEKLNVGSFENDEEVNESDEIVIGGYPEKHLMKL